MRRILAASFLAMLGGLIVLAVHAPAARADEPTTNPADIGQPQIEQCIGTEPIGVGRPPSCTFDANGNLISRSPSSPDGIGSSSSFNIAPFLILAVLWSAVPFAIAISIAKSRDEPVSTAVLLTLVLGWIGLLIVVYGQRRTADDVGRWVHGSPTATPPPPSPRETEKSPDERLRTIEELHAQGMITDAERDQRRAAVLDSL